MSRACGGKWEGGHLALETHKCLTPAGISQMPRRAALPPPREHVQAEGCNVFQVTRRQHKSCLVEKLPE